jgi:hypothetical protein
MISLFIILPAIPTRNISFPSVYTTQGSVPTSLLWSPSGCTTPLHGSIIDWLGILRDTTLGTPAATIFTIF